MFQLQSITSYLKYNIVLANFAIYIIAVLQIPNKYLHLTACFRALELQSSKFRKTWSGNYFEATMANTTAGGEF